MSYLERHFFSFYMTNFNKNRPYAYGALRLWSGAPTGVRVFDSFKTINLENTCSFWMNNIRSYTELLFKAFC